MSLQFTIRKEVDFIALAPIALGFYPHNSLVMMTLSGFHARVDLPGEDDVQACITALLNPALQHGVAQVAALTYGAQDVAVLSQFVDRFTDSGIKVIAALEVRDDEYRRINDIGWTTFDLASHPFTLEAQLNERSPRQSRAALVESIQPRGEGWVGKVNEAVELMRVVGVQEWASGATRESAGEDVKLWTAALRGCFPDSPLVSDIALLLSFTAWLSGDGALAWAALDLADSSTTLYRLIYATLDGAVSPNDWSGL